jgi:hypothetical protein
MLKSIIMSIGFSLLVVIMMNILKREIPITVIPFMVTIIFFVLETKKYRTLNHAKLLAVTSFLVFGIIISIILATVSNHKLTRYKVNILKFKIEYKDNL